MIYRDCEILNCKQRSDEWFDVRRGLLTASTLGAWIMKETTKADLKARETAICKLVAETANAWEPTNFENEAMKRGTELEPEAVKAFEVATGKTVKDVGFCVSKHGLFGCSPDGLIEADGSGLEGKIPIGSTHIKYRRAGILPPEYHWQVQMSMAVTGAGSWWFQSYCPGLAPFRIRVERTSETDELRTKLIEFSRQLRAALHEEAAAWSAAFDKN